MPFDLDAAIERWRGRLLDTSKRNPLIASRVGRSGAVALVGPDPENLWRSLIAQDRTLTFVRKGSLPIDDTPHDPQQPKKGDDPASYLASPRWRDHFLLTDLDDEFLAKRLARLDLAARTSLSEQGVTTLHLAFGRLRWYESEASDEAIESPLLLVPARLGRETLESPWEVTPDEEEIFPNYSLEQLLIEQFGLKPPPLPDPEGMDDPSWRTAYFEAIREATRHHRRWEVLDRVALGVFGFQRVAMWRDLGENRARIAAHPLCRAIAGDASAAPPRVEGLPSAGELDDATHPSTTFHVLDADSSQHEALEAAKRGASLVLDGPPGTGKSQTIANLIAEALAKGETVLFVSEKAAALEVVKARLDARGLGDFCLECHSHKANKGLIIAELGRCLGLGAERFAEPTEALTKLDEARHRLNAFVRALHEVRSPLGLSAFAVHGRLAAIREGLVSRAPVPEAATLDAATRDRRAGLLSSLKEVRGAIANRDRHPWSGLRAGSGSLSLKDDVEHHARRLAGALGRVVEAAAGLVQAGFSKEDASFDGWLSDLATAEEALTYPEVPAGWFAGDPRRVARAYVALDEASRGYRAALAELPEFSREKLDDLLPGDLAALGPGGAAEPPRDEASTVRGEAARLGTAVAALQGLMDVAKGADGALAGVVAALKVAPARVAVRDLAPLAAAVGSAAAMPEIRREWLRPDRRRELLAVVDQVSNDLREAADYRVKLVERLSPLAFGPEVAALAAGSARYRGFWRWFLPGWWSFRREAGGLYARERPSTAVLLADMAGLDAYHRRARFAREVAGQYATALIRDEGGEPDWSRTRSALDSAAGLGPLLDLFPDAGEALVSGFDRGSLADAARDLAARGREVAVAIEGVSRLRDRSADPWWPESTSLANLVSRAFGAKEAIAKDRERIEGIAGMLEPGRDLAALDLPDRLESLKRLVRCRDEARGAAARLGADRIAPRGGGPEDEGASAPGAGLPFDRDWSPERKVADWVLGLLDQHRGAAPPHVVRVVTDPEARGELAEAVSRNKKAITADLEESWRFLSGLFEPDREVSTGLRLDRVSLPGLLAWSAARASDARRIDEWARLRDLEARLAAEGMTPVFEEVLRGAYPLDDAADAYLARLYRSWLDALHAREPILGGFSTGSHEGRIAEFRGLDERSLVVATGRIRARRLAGRSPSGLGSGDAPALSELGVLMREVHKKRRHLPLRLLLRKIPGLLPRLKPCLMMSPLAVSTYLDSPESRFDLVIFDEASQVRPHDAIGAIYRGDRLVVAGDEKQLPPTAFFTRESADGDGDGDDEGGDEEAQDLADFESILDVSRTIGLVRKRLRWHYRSRREGLIAFSNLHFYGNELVTFPGATDADGTPAVRLEHVAEGRWTPGAGGGFNAREAARAAEIVMGHARERPDESLGVIAFSRRQQVAILDELERLRRADPGHEAFFDGRKADPFFVKNLETVQGDERDAIVLSVGYGPDASAKLAMRFGPLNRDGGERRLNVAITRARSSMTVASSIRAIDLDPSRLNSRGPRLLRAYLDYAERGAAALVEGPAGETGRGFDSPFEAAVAAELIARGLDVRKQVGCGGYRIDLAIVDPEHPGRFLLGVECDGATYHASATARDRDRLREGVLRRLGWRIRRVWSTDWTRDREGQVARVLAAVEEAKRAIPGPPPPPEPSPAPEPLAIAEPEPAGPEPGAFGSIDDVPAGRIDTLILEALGEFGATESDEIKRVVSRRLGFQRLGTNIKAAIETRLGALLAGGRIAPTEGGWLRLSPSPEG